MVSKRTTDSSRSAKCQRSPVALPAARSDTPEAWHSGRRSTEGSSRSIPRVRAGGKYPYNYPARPVRRSPHRGIATGHPHTDWGCYTRKQKRGRGAERRVASDYRSLLATEGDGMLEFNGPDRLAAAWLARAGCIERRIRLLATKRRAVGNAHAHRPRRQRRN